jgi:hypothetical protein
MPTIRRASSLLLFVAGLLLLSRSAPGQPVLDTLKAIDALDGLAVAEAVRLEREVWPGYRYDTLGLMYIVPNVGKLALRWPGAAPGGMEAYGASGRAWWADTRPVSWRPGLAVATLPVTEGASRGEILGTALHEAFHAYQVTQRRQGSRFGAGENSLITATYPLFDIENEAAMAAENRILRMAVAAGSEAEARRLAAAFINLRETRQARLDEEVVEYEKAAELHEGLPQYVLLRGLAVLAERHPSLHADAERERAREAAVLDSTLEQEERSVRRRFYASGSHIAMLLDRFTGNDWKQRVQRGDVWLQDLLAESVGRGDGASSAAAVDSFLPKAVRAVSERRERRQALRDSILSSSTRLMLDASGAQWCSFDPQNVLSTGTGELLHTMMLRLCRGDRMTAFFTTPVVEDPRARLVSTSLSAPPEIVAAGAPVNPPGDGEAITLEDVRIRADGVEIEMRKAVLVGRANRLLVLPLAP